LDSELERSTFRFAQDLSKTSFKFELPLKVTHKSTGFYFEIAALMPPKPPRLTYFRATYYPGSAPLAYVANCKEWSGVIKRLDYWLRVLEKEVSQPDPWLLLNQGTVLKDTIPAVAGMVEKFDKAELSKVHEHLDTIRQFLISETRPSKEQLKLIDERLSYLESSASRQSKQDWAHTAIGVMFTIAIGLAMAPEQANRLLQFTANFIKMIFVPLLK